MSWDARFASEDYHYGTEPAAFVTRETWRFAPGTRLLSVAEGEGRNAVWLARQGLLVTALDGSAVALNKAARLAATAGVPLATLCADLAEFDWPEGQWDAVLGCFFQFAAPDLRDAILAGMARSLRPGGIVALHGFALRQIANTSGGPKDVGRLWSLDILRTAFCGFEVLHQADYDAEISEGRGHVGPAALIDFVARKPR